MRICLSDLCAPGLHLPALLERARDLGCEGVMVSGHVGRFDAGPLALRPESRREIVGSGIALAALHTGISLVHRSPKAAKGAEQLVADAIVLAHGLGCRQVIVSAGRLSGLRLKTAAMERIAATLRNLAAEAGRQGLALLFENAGDLAGSQDVWFLRDAVNSPALRLCLNPVECLRLGEPPSLVIPRLSSALSMVLVDDVDFDAAGQPRDEVERGGTRLSLGLLVELLKGVAFGGWVGVALPPGGDLAGSAPSDTTDRRLEALVALLKREIARKQVELSAYKGDKHAPRFSARASRPFGASHDL
jgi:sugar phosphate isomerase/epimerase